MDTNNNVQPGLVFNQDFCLKFRYCEKATKFENSPTFFLNYSVFNVKTIREIFVAFSEYLNFKTQIETSLLHFVRD